MEIAYLAAAAALAGFSWTVQLVVYPQMALVPPVAFPAHERAHQRRITPLVAVLFGALTTGTGLLAIDQSAWAVIVAAALLAVILATTWFGAVPRHRRLAQRWDAADHRALLRWDLVRTLAASAAAVLAVALALR